MKSDFVDILSTAWVKKVMSWCIGYLLRKHKPGITAVLLNGMCNRQYEKYDTKLVRLVTVGVFKRKDFHFISVGTGHLRTPEEIKYTLQMLDAAKRHLTGGDIKIRGVL